MITLTFDLNYEKMAQDGITEGDMLNPMREYLLQNGYDFKREN